MAIGLLLGAFWRSRILLNVSAGDPPASMGRTGRNHMTTLVIGSGLIGSQVARILVERGETPVLMDVAAQREAIGQIVDLAKGTLVQGDVLRPLSIVDVLRNHAITRIAHTAANPLLTLGAQKEPYA